MKISILHFKKNLRNAVVIIAGLNVTGDNYSATRDVGGQEQSPIESRYYSGFFVLSEQVLVPRRGQELVPIAEKDKNMSRLPIR